MAYKSRETIDMDSKVDFDQISFLNRNGILGKRRIVCTYFIHRNTCGEGKSFECGLFIIHLTQLLIHQTITENTQLNNLRSNCYFLYQLSQYILIKLNKYHLRFWLMFDTSISHPEYSGFLLLIYPSKIYSTKYKK